MYIRIKRTETPEELTHLHGKLPTRDASSHCCPIETKRADGSRRGPGLGAGAHGDAARCGAAACAGETARFARAPGTPPPGDSACRVRVVGGVSCSRADVLRLVHLKICSLADPGDAFPAQLASPCRQVPPQGSASLGLSELWLSAGLTPGSSALAWAFGRWWSGF